MPRRKVQRAPLPLFAAALLALAACGGMVVVDASHDPGAGGAAPDSGTPPPDAAMDATIEPPPVDAGSDAPPACDDSAVCSWLLNHEYVCLGATSVGDFCDFLATPCSSNPPDCDAIAAIVGADAHLASCGDGTSFCDVNWVGTLTKATLDSLCAAHAASGQPLDCVMD